MTSNIIERYCRMLAERTCIKTVLWKARQKRATMWGLCWKKTSSHYGQYFL